VSEVVELNLDDVDTGAHTVICGAGSMRRRVVTLYGAAAQALRHYIERGRAALTKADGEQALFVNHRGQRLTRQGLWLIIRQYAAAVGIADNITPHALRHSFAAHLLENGAAPEEVQKRMGNLSAGSADTYRRRAHPHGGEVVLDGVRVRPD
ncbi:MAG: tyrosine-type recombinase/integrase, partial [Caldilineaceae bacterium]|nr:tyrosine-type recombinase/integrase [Caldilineaceae bacterium]